MSKNEKVSITISIAKSYRDQLRTMAARQNLHDPDKLTSASTLAREIISDHLDELERIEADFNAAAETGHDRVNGHTDESVEDIQEG